MKFKETPACHGDDPRYLNTTIAWDTRAGDPPDVRRCSYCGSIHPEDLVTLGTVPIQLEIADWKYGWPHKVYVTVAGNMLKFYSKHFVDCDDDEARAAVNSVLSRVGLELAIAQDGHVGWMTRPVGQEILGEQDRVR